MIGLAVLTAAEYFYAVVWYLRNKHHLHDRLEYFLGRILPLSLALLAGIYALSLNISWEGPSRIAIRTDIANLQHQFNALSARVESLDRVSQTIPLDANRHVQSSTTKLGTETSAVQRLEIALAAQAETLKGIDALLLSAPERFVTIPLLQRDFQSLKEEMSSTKAALDTLRTLLTEATSQNRWTIGTLALGMLVLVVPVVRSMLGPSALERQYLTETPRKGG